MSPQAAPFTELARAKVNLTLTIKGKRRDGYHELQSLVAFASCGDGLEFTPAKRFALRVEGPFAPAIDGENLVVRAVGALRAAYPGVGTGLFRLRKTIPVAAGLGGGSADAAAAMRALLRAFPQKPQPDEQVRELAARIGADIPVCLAQQTAIMTGTGGRLFPVQAMPVLHALLVNPGIKLATGSVFAALQAPPCDDAAIEAGSISIAAIAATRLAAPDGLKTYLLEGCNGLEAPAARLAPGIIPVLEGLRAEPGCWLARLSGSGPTCFGLFESEEQAAQAALSLQARRPGWWIRAAALGG